MTTQANEIRVGNYFTRELQSPRGLDYIKYFKIDELALKQIFGDSPYMALNDLFPIKITEDLLLQCGFVKEDKSDYGWLTMNYFTDCMEATEIMCIAYNITSKRLAFYDTVDDETPEVVSYPIYTAKVVEHFHTLQNILFAMAGIELTINPETN